MNSSMFLVAVLALSTFGLGIVFGVAMQKDAQAESVEQTQQVVVVRFE